MAELPQVAEELGVPILCDSTGTFSAEMNGETFSDKSITKVKKWIKTAKPTVKVLIYKGTFFSLPPFEVVQIATVQPYGDGLRASTSKATDWSGHYNVPHKDRAYLFDEETARMIRDLWRKAHDDKNAVEKQAQVDIEKVIATMTPLTVESYVAALAEVESGKA